MFRRNVVQARSFETLLDGFYSGARSSWHGAVADPAEIQLGAMHAVQGSTEHRSRLAEDALEREAPQSPPARSEEDARAVPESAVRV